MLDKDDIIIPIDPDSRYIILVKGMPFQEIASLKKVVDDWQESSEKFCIIAVRDDIDIRLERLDA